MSNEKGSLLVIMNHYPYETTTKMEAKRLFCFVAQAAQVLVKVETKAPHMSCQKGMATVVDLFSRCSGANALLAASEHLEEEVREWQKWGK